MNGRLFLLENSEIFLDGYGEMCYFNRKDNVVICGKWLQKVKNGLRIFSICF